MAAMFKRPRPIGHPPPLAATVSNFKPRAQWSNSGSSIFLYVNLPGFYRDQIEIKKDEKTKTIQIQGQRPLSSQTKARFNETYRVPDKCDMTKLSTSFAHGLLTVEFPAVVEGKKPEKAVQDPGKIVQRPNQEKPEEAVKKIGTSHEKVAPMVKEEEPKTYKSVVEGKKAAPTSSQQRSGQKVKEGEAYPSLGGKERGKEGKVVERKEAAQKIVQKLKEKEAARSTPTIGGSLKPKVHAKAERLVERKGNVEIGQKLKEEVKIGLGQKKEEKYTKPVVADDEARKIAKETAAMNLAETKAKERVERIVEDVNGNVKSKQDKKDERMVGEKVSKGEIQEGVEQKKVEETGLVKETGDAKGNAEAAKPKMVDSAEPLKKESSRGGEDEKKIVEKSSGYETNPFLDDEGHQKTDMYSPAVGGMEEESQKHELSLVNVGVAALVIMGFGAYIFLPLLK